MESLRLAVLTVSDAASCGQRDDTSGDAIEAWARERGYQLAYRRVLPDEHDRLRGVLIELTDAGDVDLILTTGGTGFTDRDVTPEATRAAIEREAPGIAEAIRLEGASTVPTAWLSRAVAGIRARTLIVNLPGSTGGVRDGLAVLDRLAPHAVQLLRGQDTHRHPHHG